MTRSTLAVALAVVSLALASLLAASLLAASFFARPAAAATKYQVAKPAQAGTLAGTVTLEGTPPAPKSFLITKNREVCGSGKKEVPTIALSGKAIDEVVVYFKDVPKGKDWPKGEHVIDNVKCEFHPHVQAMPINQDLLVRNSDPVIHNTHAYHSASEKGGLTVINIALPTEGMTVPKKMTRAGVHRVDCDAHNWMRGWVFVGENPYYAVTAKGGKYQIDGIPPGKYTVVFWQEALGEQTKQVTIEPGKTATLDVVMQGK